MTSHTVTHTRTHSLRRELKIARYYVASKGGKRLDRGEGGSAGGWNPGSREGWKLRPIMSQRRLNARRRHICLQSLAEG